MNPRFKIYPPKVGTFTRMKVYRGSDPKTILDTVPIFDGAFSDVFTDTNPGASRTIWYQVSVAEATGNYIPTVAFSVAYCTDWGPAGMSVSSGMAYNHSSVVSGPASGGILTPQTLFTMPQQNLVSNWAQMVTLATGTIAGDIPATPVTDYVWNMMYADGRVIYVPFNVEGPFRITSKSVTQIQAADLTFRLAQYLNDPATTANIYTVDGFKWKLKVMDYKAAASIGECFIPNGVNMAIKCYATSVTRSASFVAGETSGYRFEGNTFYTLAPPTTDAIATFYPFTYFEYIGPA